MDPSSAAAGVPAGAVRAAAAAPAAAPSAAASAASAAAASASSSRLTRVPLHGVPDFVVATRAGCVFSARLCMALYAKGLRFSTELVPKVDDAACPAWFKEASPAGEVPVLLVRGADGSMTTASDATDTMGVIRWLDTAFPGTPALVPAEAAAEVNKWTAFAEGELHGAYFKSMMPPKPPVRAEANKRLHAALAAFDAALAANAAAAGGRRGPYFNADGSRATLDFCVAQATLLRLPSLRFIRGFTPDAALVHVAAYVFAAQQEPTAYSQEHLMGFYLSKTPMMMQGPLSATRLQHQAMRAMLRRLVSWSAALAAMPAGARVASDLVDDLSDAWTAYRRFITGHSVLEDEVVYKYLEKMRPGITAQFQGEHEHEIPELLNIDKLVTTAAENVAAAATAAPAAPVDASASAPPIAAAAAAAVAAVATRFAAMESEHEAHFQGEERVLFPLVQDIPKDMHAPLFKAALGTCRGDLQHLLLPRILEVSEAPDAAQYAYNFLNVHRMAPDPAMMEEVVVCINDGVRDGVLSRARLEYLLARLPDLKPHLDAAAAKSGAARGGVGVAL